MRLAEESKMYVCDTTNRAFKYPMYGTHDMAVKG
jgi:hypothetical protein